MSQDTNSALVEEIIKGNRYLTLATADGASPWVAPLEYLVDENLNFYFLSVPSSRHARDLQRSDNVAIAIFESVQAEYSPDLSTTLRGVQIEAKARELSEDEYPDAVITAIEALSPPMPPYSVYKIEPVRFYLPIIARGVNDRIEVAM